MVKLLDIPFYCLPFFTLVQLTTVSKEIRARSVEALKVKNRGEELTKYLAALSHDVRDAKITGITVIDTWFIWMHLAATIFSPTQTLINFMKSAPMSVDICTTHRNTPLQLEVSAQHYMDILEPYRLFGELRNLLQSSVYDVIQVLKTIMTCLFGGTAAYDELWWRTSPITFYEVDLVHNVYYQYADVTLTFVGDNVQLSIPHRRTRVPAHIVRNELSRLLAHYQM